MKVYRLAVLPGDGIGPEVMTESVQTLTILADMHSGFRFDIQQFERQFERTCPGLPFQTSNGQCFFLFQEQTDLT